MPPEMISNIRRSLSTSIPPAVLGANMLPSEDQGESDRNKRRRDEPHRQQQDRQMAGALGGLRRQGLGVHDDALARPVVDQSLQPLQQVRYPVHRLGDDLEPLAQLRLGSAVLAHPSLDQRP